MTERKHDRPLYIMMTVEERAAVAEKAKAAGLSLREYVGRALDAYQNPASLESRVDNLEQYVAFLHRCCVAGPRV